MGYDPESPSSRLQSELDLLHAMYPDGAVSYFPKGREFCYTHHHHDEDGPQNTTKGTLLLRLPDNYPLSGRPQVISATATISTTQKDLRSESADMIQSHYGGTQGEGEGEGEEALDALVLAFQDLVVTAATAIAAEDSTNYHGKEEITTTTNNNNNKEKTKKKTIVIWLHHLLNTNKRKLAITPSSSSSSSSSSSIPAAIQADDENLHIHGVTKPGYPGVLVYTGPKEAVEVHVAELRVQRWQGFQVRFDSEDVGDKWWRIGTGKGEGERKEGENDGPRIREVESMSDVVQSILGEEEKGVFLGVMGIR